MAKDYEKIRELLEEQETFPIDFMVKFIGRNSAKFRAGCQAFEARFPALRPQSSRESSGGNHLAQTYILAANGADEVIEVLKATALIDDVLIVL